MTSWRQRTWRQISLLALLPLAILLGLGAAFYWGLWNDDEPLSSTLIGNPVPAVDLPPIDGRNDGLATADLTGEVSIVNVWASWCGPCRLEHPNLLKLAEDEDIDLVGINYKDAPGNARRFLGLLGNPYKIVGTDPTGRAAIEWGVHGVPETFVVDGNGIVVYKHVGPITPGVLETQVLPAIARAKAE